MVSPPPAPLLRSGVLNVAKPPTRSAEVSQLRSKMSPLYARTVRMTRTRTPALPASGWPSAPHTTTVAVPVQVLPPACELAAPHDDPALQSGFCPGATVASATIGKAKL